MKKTILLFFLVLFFAQTYGQKVRLGLRFGPGIAFARITEKQKIDTLTFKANGVGVRFFAGPEINFILGNNYVFTTGLWYMSKKADITLKQYDIKQLFNLQYLQLPATMKLYTNEIAVDTKLYFQFGATADIKLQQKLLNNPTFDYVNKFKFYNFSALLGAGVQFQMGQNTYIFGGVTYQRGLMNSIVVNRNFQTTDAQGNPVTLTLPDKKAIQLKTDLLSLDLGIRF